MSERSYTGLMAAGGDVQVENDHDMVVLSGLFGNSVMSAYHSSCLGLLGHELQRPSSERRLGKITGLKGLYVANNRQNLADRFFDGDTSAGRLPWLLQVDSDIEFPPDFLDTLLGLAYSQPGCKILAMNVPLGKFPTVAFNKTDEPGVHDCLYPLPNAPVFPVDAAATAIFLVHRDVFEDIADRFGRCWFHHSYVPFKLGDRPDVLRELRFHEIGEDLAFCARAAAAGHQTYVAHGVPGVYHHKVRPLSELGQVEESLKVHEKLAQSDSGEVGEIVREGVG